MKLVLLRILEQQRALYNQPRGMARFRDYLRQMTGGGDDIVLPIVGMNPMGKEKAKAAYDALLTCHAEDVAAEALAQAEQRLDEGPGELRVALVVQDDAEGAWSQAETLESVHWQSDASARRGFAPVHFLSSRAPYDAAAIRRATLESVYRIAHIRRHGTPRSLRDVMGLEGGASRFAGATPALDEAALREARAVLAAHLDAVAWPTIFAAMYGDGSARAWGHRPLGLPPRAGFEVALDDAWAGGAGEGSPQAI